VIRCQRIITKRSQRDADRLIIETGDARNTGQGERGLEKGVFAPRSGPTRLDRYVNEGRSTRVFLSGKRNKPVVMLSPYRPPLMTPEREKAIGHAVDAMQQGLPWGGKLRQFRRQGVHMPASRKLWKDTRIDEGRIEPEGTPPAATVDRGPQPGGDVLEPPAPA
jgi:hypothetical protein